MQIAVTTAVGEPADNVLCCHSSKSIRDRTVAPLHMFLARARRNSLTLDQQFSIGEKSGEVWGQVDDCCTYCFNSRADASHLVGRQIIHHSRGHLARDWVLILGLHTSEKRVHQLHRERSFPLPVRVAPSHQLGLDSVRAGRERHYTPDFLEVSAHSAVSLPNLSQFHQLLPSLLISLCQFRANTALATAALVQYLAGVA